MKSVKYAMSKARAHFAPKVETLKEAPALVATLDKDTEFAAKIYSSYGPRVARHIIMAKKTKAP